jgi:hypothetical protein
MRQTQYRLATISLITLLYCFAIASNLSPFLRGLGAMPQWEWQYRAVALTPRLLAPLLLLALIVYAAKIWMGKSANYLVTHERQLVGTVFLLAVFFQVAVLFASPGGLLVLVQRTIHPTIIGYFSASLTIRSLSSFFEHYPRAVSSYPNLAQYHPPGSILLFWLINQLSLLVTHVITLPLTVQPAHSDLRILWNSLAEHEKLGALVAGYVVLLLGALATVPMYYLGKLVYSPKVGLKAAILFMLLPCVSAFLPFNDVFSPLFTAASCYYFLKGFKEGSLRAFLLSGIIFFVGAFFTLTVLAVLLIYGVAARHETLSRRIPRQRLLAFALAFTAGILLLPLILYLVFRFDAIAATQAIVSQHLGFVVARQEQHLWLIYNYYDFFMFLGIPLLLLFILQAKDALRDLLHKHYSVDVMFAGFCVVTLLIDLSGKMNGETGRTWTPFVPFILLPLVQYLCARDQRGREFLVILFLQGIQVLTVSLYLVTVS